MSVSSKSASSRSTHLSTAHPFVVRSTEITGTPVVKAVMVNRSPEQTVANHRFEVPLFPGHQKPSQRTSHRTSQRAPGQPIGQPIGQSNVQSKLPFSELSFSDQYSREIDASDVAALKKQQADFARYSEEQTKRSQSAIESLQQQLSSLSVQTQAEQQPISQSLLQSSVQSSARKSTLSHIPTTYQVPKRTQVRWIDRLLSWVPKFLWLFFLGIALSVLCAIALSSSSLAPVGLLSSLSFSIRSVVPYVFVLSVVSLGITAVWDTFR